MQASISDFAKAEAPAVKDGPLMPNIQVSLLDPIPALSIPLIVSKIVTVDMVRGAHILVEEKVSCAETIPVQTEPVVVVARVNDGPGIGNVVAPILFPVVNIQPSGNAGYSPSAYCTLSIDIKAGVILPLLQLIPQGICCGGTTQLLVSESNHLQPPPVAVAAEFPGAHVEGVVAPETFRVIPTSTVSVESHNPACELDP